LLDYRVTADGRCPGCARPLAGRFDPVPGHFGARRVPVHLGRNVPVI
jgi:pyruvate formate lyase activating enzyme